MGNFNTGSVVPVEQITGFRAAVHDFAEGNNTLEELLLNAHTKEIETIACCAGHQEKHYSPYVAIWYNYPNMPYLFAILSELKDKGYTFGFSKSPFRSFVNISENNNFDFVSPTELFKDLNTVINNFDKSINYFEHLPADLKMFFLIMQMAEDDERLDVNKPSGFFQMGYEKINGIYYQLAEKRKNFYYSKT